MKLGLSPESEGLLQFTVFTNLSILGDTVSLGTLISPRGRQAGREQSYQPQSKQRWSLNGGTQSKGLFASPL